MDLREPPRSDNRQHSEPIVRRLLWAILVALSIMSAAMAYLAVSDRQEASGWTRDEEVAAKLMAAGALDDAVELYERALEGGAVPAAERSGIAYSLGTKFLESGRYESALRWLYQAEAEAADNPGNELPQDLGPKIVHVLERLGRYHAAQAALGSRSGPSDSTIQRPQSDAVVAVIGDREIRRSEVERAIDDLPPEVAAQLANREGRGRILQQLVADELIWRKASKLEYDKDPEVLYRQEQLFRQLAVARFVEQEIVAKIEVDEGDLANYFETNKNRYQQQASGPDQDGPEITLERARARVENDYRSEKAERAYRSWIDTEMATVAMELYPERMDDGG